MGQQENTLNKLKALCKMKDVGYKTFNRSSSRRIPSINIKHFELYVYTEVITLRDTSLAVKCDKLLSHEEAIKFISEQI